MANKIDIPNGWEVKKLGEVVNINSSSLKENTDPNYAFTYIDLSSVNQGKIDIPIEQIYFKEAPSRARRLIEINNIIISTVRPNLQGFAYIDFTCKDYIVSTGFAVLSYKCNINMKFLYNMFYSNILMKQINAIITGSNYPAISSADIKNFIIPVPPLAEQEKIAEILSLWDKAIEHTKELIAYKEKQKKGLMQNLLTGKKRLSGFTDKWKTYIVKELGLVITGKTPNTEKNEYYGDEFLFITPTDIHYKYTTKTERNLSKSGLNKSKLIPKNSVLITCIASIGKNTINKSDCAINQQINAIVLNNNFYYEYIYYYMTFNSPYLLKFAGKSATSIINKTTFEEIDVTIPPLDEQKAIADILCKADEEIELLKKQLDLYTEQKKGLMQNLLTGKVRVTV